MAYKVVSAETFPLDRMLDFLKHHEDTSLFLLSNYADYGLKMNAELNSGNYYIVLQEEEVCAVFSHTRRGTLLIQSEHNDPKLFDAVLDTCLRERTPLKGIIGDWEIAHPFWEYLKVNQFIRRETFTSKEVLYTLEVPDTLTYPTDARALAEEDQEAWGTLHLRYIEEMGYAHRPTKEEQEHEFQQKLAKKVLWGCFQEGKPVSIADLNARYEDLGQVGGVFTLPQYRNQGCSRRTVQALINDCKDTLAIRKLIIFTGEENTPAKKVYESLGAKQIGHYALLFGED